MKDKTKVIALRIRTHWRGNRKVYYMGMVAAGAIALQQKNVRDFTKFMIEKNIDPEEYFCPEAYEESINA